MARKVLATLSKHFVEVQDYDYEPGSPSHKWSSKKIVTAFQKDLTDLITAATTALKVCFYHFFILKKENFL